MRMRLTVVRDAIITSLVVGPVLTFINHAERMISGDQLPLMKVTLTFLVPFFVAFVAGHRAANRMERPE